MSSLNEEEISLFHHHICEGIGDPQRLRLLYLVADKARNVTDLTQALDISQPTVSHHLRILRERGLVVAERVGTSVYYSLADPRILEAIEILREFVSDLLMNRATAVKRS